MDRSFAEKLMFIGIVVSCFDGLNFLPGMTATGVTSEASLYFLIIVMISICSGYILFYKPIAIHHGERIIKYILLLAFFGILAGGVNYSQIIGHEWKGRMGEFRFLATLMLLLYDFFIVFIFIYVLERVENPIKYIYKALRYSAYIVIGYGIIQIVASIYGGFCLDIVNSIQPYISPYTTEKDVDRYFAISSVRMEPSDLGVYMAAVLPWLYLGSRFYEKDKMSKMLLVGALLLIYFSGSRLAYIVTMLEILSISCIEFFMGNIKLKMQIIVSIVLTLGVCVLTLPAQISNIYDVMISISLNSDGGRDASNITRFGLQTAALNMFKDNILGVGLGQFKMLAALYLPDWSYFSAEILDVANGGTPERFYGAWNAHLRILAEFGIFGFTVWIIMILDVIKKYILIIRMKIGDEKIKCGVILISFLGTVLALINFDTLTSYYFWLFVSLASVIDENERW